MPPKRVKQFRGLLTALITPMAAGRVDEPALTRLVEAQIAGGVDGLVPCGTTGEAATLSHAEHIHVVEVVTRAADGRVPVLAGAGSNSTHEAIELARACKELGVDGTLQVVPYYNKPPQDGLIRHFESDRRRRRAADHPLQHARAARSSTCCPRHDRAPGQAREHRRPQGRDRRPARGRALARAVRRRLLAAVGRRLHAAALPRDRRRRGDLGGLQPRAGADPGPARRARGR